jgi:hypothetical protein
MTWTIVALLPSVLFTTTANFVFSSKSPGRLKKRSEYWTGIDNSEKRMAILEWNIPEYPRLQF